VVAAALPTHPGGAGEGRGTHEGGDMREERHRRGERDRIIKVGEMRRICGGK
jgi:hypothetical protein